MTVLKNSRLRPKQAAVHVGCAEGTLAKMRMRGDGPPYHKIGPKIVVYFPEELDRWLEERKRLSTSEQPTSGSSEDGHHV